MSTPKHAPGPWRVVPFVDAIDIVDADGRPVAHLADRDLASVGMPPDNGRLIAAAPEMLATLTLWANAEQARAYIPDRERPAWDEIMAKTRAAIAKATGTAASTEGQPS